MAAWLRGLRVKLLLLVTVPVLSIALGGAVAFYTVQSLHDNIADLGREDVPKVLAIGTMAEGLQGMMRSYWAAHASGRNEELRKKFLTRAAEYAENISVAKEEYGELPLDEKDKANWEKVSAAWGETRSIVKLVKEKFALNTPAGDEEAKTLILEKLRLAIAPMEEGLRDIGTEQGASSQDIAESAERFSKTVLLAFKVLIPVVILVIAAFGLLLASKLSTRLGEIVSKISNSADEVGMASQQLSDASHKLSSGASEAASSLEETVASLEQLSSMVKQNADNSNQAGSLSQSARSSAEEGEGEVRHLITAMGEISTSSKKIEEIINVIDDIAFQTNLLALNAAVEAARAGDQGRGFAVVAEAVRALAQRSSDAAKDINNLIKESVEKVTRGTQIADRSGDVLKKIVSNSKKVADLTGEIAMASQEQATGIAQISKAMNQLDQATQSNAASAEETASTSQQLSGEATNLRNQVIELVLVVNGTSTLNGSKTEPVAAMRLVPTQAHAQVTTPKSGSAENAIPFGDDDDNGGMGNISGF